MTRNDFPKDFFWGTATASYQIEGADLADGKGPSIWTTFSHTPGKIHKNETGDMACDHYHRYKHDVALMANLGVNAYRFSISWSRLFPRGRGERNHKGFDFYARLIDLLLENGIEPFITLYHWDLPDALQNSIGGWESRDISAYFGDYADAVFRSYGDKVRYWITLNEPFCSSHVSYLFGEHAPGLNDLKKSFLVAHNLLRANGEAARRFREVIKDGKIGLTNVSQWVEPVSDTPEDAHAADLVNQFFNDWFYATPLDGEYPKDLSKILIDLGVMPDIHPGDMDLISEPIDFWGVNYYTRLIARSDPRSEFGYNIVPGDLEKTEMGWEVYPAGLQGFLERAYRKYGEKPLFVTENGMADNDVPEKGKIRDIRRQKYLHDHFEASLKAMNRGVDLRGYFVWTLMDNFEWSHGYSKRFGIIYTDYDNRQERLPKDSYYWFADFLKGE